ncbi:hypothetical protein Scep_009828 [Stephania cephalantha]|uniref:Uncharacterized protein n=1 Tax=Stephania cephalantha TaxID=152367 RepID=A0AAP0JWD1_9MAGN
MEFLFLNLLSLCSMHYESRLISSWLFSRASFSSRMFVSPYRLIRWFFFNQMQQNGKLVDRVSVFLKTRAAQSDIQLDPTT